MQKIGCVALGRKSIALEVADGLAHNTGDDDARNQTEKVGGRSNEKGQQRVPVENVADDDVDFGKTSLYCSLVKTGFVERAQRRGDLQ